VKKLIYLIPFLLGAGEDFISDFEYGQMLYQNPRGISCAACHGEEGEGKEIVSYRENNETVIIKGVDIRESTLPEIEAVVARNHPVMPKYYLTHEEVKAIYHYLQEAAQQKEEEKNP
jgi:mono/diheme cytochrome c family protein